MRNVILLCFLFLSSFAHAGVWFNTGDASQIVGVNRVANVKDGTILKAYISVCNVVVVPGKGMAHLSPYADKPIKDVLFELLSWIEYDDKVIIVPSGESFITSVSITPEIIKGYLNNVLFVKNVIVYSEQKEVQNRIVTMTPTEWKVHEPLLNGATIRAGCYPVNKGEKI